MKTAVDLARGLGSVVAGNGSVAVTGISHDSREINDGHAFVAIRGYRHNGEEFIDDAVRRGAAVIVTETPCSPRRGVTHIRVSNARAALARLAARFYDHPSDRLRVIAVTGTNGKTTTTFYIDAILRAAGYRTGLVGTICYRIGDRIIPSSRTTPESVDIQRYLHEMAACDTDYAIIEASAHGLTLGRLADTEVDVAVFTNLSCDHFNFYRDHDQYIQAKAILFQTLGDGTVKTTEKYGSFNIDDTAALKLMNGCTAPVLTYGLRGRGEFQIAGLNRTEFGTRCRLLHPGGELTMETGLPGMFNLYNALAAASVGLREGVSPDIVVRAIEQTVDIPGRCSRIINDDGLSIWVDFAHNPEALRSVLIAAREHAQRRRVVLVTGCEGGTDRSKRQETGRVAARYADYSIITSDNIYHDDPGQILRDIEFGLLEAGRRGGYAIIADRHEALCHAIDRALAGDLIVVAGKGHERHWVVGDHKIPFDDRQVIHDLLRTRRRTAVNARR